MKRRIGKALILCVEAFAVLIALLAGAAFFVHWKISHGGLSLDLAGGPVERALEQRLTRGSDVSIGSISLERDPQGARSGGAGPLRVLANDLRIVAPDGSELIDLPALTFRVQTGDIIRGNLVPRYVEISGAELSLSRDSAGRVDLGIMRESREDEAEETNLFETLLGMRAGDDDGAPLFQGAILTDTSVTFVDELSGQVWRTQGAEAEMWRASQGYELSLEAPFRIDDEDAWLKVDLALDDENREASLDIAVRTAPVDKIVGMIAGPGAGDRIVAAVSGRIATTASYDGSVTAMKVDLAATEGQVTPLDTAIPFDRIALQADYLPERRTFNITELGYDIAGNAGDLEGYVSLGAVGEDGRLEPERVTFNLAARDLVLDLPEILPEPLSVASGTFEGYYDIAERRLAFDSLAADYFGEQASGSLQILLPLEEGQSTGVIADAAITGALSPQEILRGWPVILADGARRWIRDRLPEGRISGIDFTMDMPRGAIRPATPLANDMMRLAFSFQDVTAIIVPGMTPLSGGSGSAVVLGNRFDLEATGGAIGDVAVTEGAVEMPAFMPKGAPAYFRASIGGDLSDILGVLNEEPLSFMDKAGFPPARFSGEAVFNFEIMRPQLSYVPQEDYSFSGSGNFVDVSIQSAMAGYDITDAAGSLDLSDDGLTVSGAGELAGLPVDYNWSRSFGETPEILLTANGLLNAQTGDEFGVSFRQFLRGNVPYTVQARQVGSRYDRISFSADLTDSHITLDMLNYDKPAGAVGSLDISLVPPMPTENQPRWLVEEIALDTENLDIDGNLILEESGALVQASFDRLFIRDRADVDLSVTRGPGGVEAVVDGAFASIDLLGSDPFGQPGARGGQGGFMPDDIAMSVRLDRLALRGGVSVDGFSARLARGGGNLRNVAMSGDFAGGGSFVVTLERGMRNIGRELVVETDNLGAVSAGLFGITSIDGGNAAYRATLLEDGPIAGTLTADDFRVSDAPVMARLLSAGSLTGLADLLNGEGIEFSDVSADIQYQDGTMTIVDARATGPSLGVSVGGDVSFTDNLFDVNGAVAPAYGVNSMFGDIPGLGELLVSREGEGVVAFSYTIDGPVTGPTVTVNALSLFTPGIFRRIFEPIRAGRATTAELLDEAVSAARAQGTVPLSQYEASPEQMRMLADSLDVFRRDLEQRRQPGP